MVGIDDVYFQIASQIANWKHALKRLEIRNGEGANLSADIYQDCY